MRRYVDPGRAAVAAVAAVPFATPATMPRTSHHRANADGVIALYCTDDGNRTEHRLPGHHPSPDATMTHPQRTWTVDSIEEGIAMVEEDGGRMVQVPAWLLPDGAREGAVLRARVEQRAGSAVVTVHLDHDATERAFTRSREQLKGPTGNDPGGDIVL